MIHYVLQVTCTVFGIAIIYLNAREKTLTWPLQMIATVLGFFIYYSKSLYAKCLLNIIYLIYCLLVVSFALYTAK